MAFFQKKEKIEWLEECCTEFNVLKGSSRERMCNSVLTPEQVQIVSKLDKKAMKDTDVGGAYIGQDRRLLWTTRGLSKFKNKVKKLKTVPKDGDLVDSEFLEENQDVRQEGIKNGWFKEEEEMKGNKGTATAVLQTGGLADGCKLTGMDPCHEDTKKLKIKTCMAGTLWQVSDKPDADLDEETCQMIRQNKAAIEVSTPDECLEQSFSLKEFGKITRRFFEYKEVNVKKVGKTLKDVLPDKPIMCYVESDLYTCGDFVREKFDQDFGCFERISRLPILDRSERCSNTTRANFEGCCSCGCTDPINVKRSRLLCAWSPRFSDQSMLSQNYKLVQFHFLFTTEAAKTARTTENSWKNIFQRASGTGLA